MELAEHNNAAKVIRVVGGDRNEPGEDDRARRCNDQLLEALFAAGMFPFRLGVHSMHAANQAAGACWDLILHIKDSLDPNRILAPGRYCRMDTNNRAPKL